VTGNLRRIYAFNRRRSAAPEINRLALAVFRGLAWNFIDFFHFKRISPAACRRLFTTDGLHHLDEALAFKKGVIMTSGHIGAFEMGALIVTANGHRPSQIVRPWEDSRANALFAQQRARRGVDVIHLGNAAGGSLRALRKGGIVAILGDIDYTQRDDRTLFMGAEARLPLGPARLSIKTGAPVVPFFVLRRPDRRYAIRFCEPIVPTSSSTLEGVRLQIVKVLEEGIRKNPEQWILFFDFWDCELSLELARKGFAVLVQSGRKRDLTAV